MRMLACTGFSASQLAPARITVNREYAGLESSTQFDDLVIVSDLHAGVAEHDRR